MADAVLIDVGWVPAPILDCCLEDMHKALAEDGTGDEAAIWDPVPNPWLTAHVEAITARLSGILSALQAAFTAAVYGEAEGQLAKADVPWRRWNENEMQEVRFQMEAKPTSQYVLEDWLKLVEWLIARYLPDDVIQSEAEYLSVKAALLGKIQATMPVQHTLSPFVEAMAELVPTRFARVLPRALAPVELSILRIAKARAADMIDAVSDKTRHTMKRFIIEHVQAGLLGQSAGTAQALRQRLFDNFGQLNRDFRRIAVTEAGECVNQGVVANAPVGSKLLRTEAYRGACPFCKSINGKVFDVVAPDAAEKDGQTQVWLGKTNVGRSAAPRRRTAGGLVARAEGELWWPAAGLQHPHCRGAWSPVSEKPPEVSQEFADMLNGMIAEAQAKVGFKAPGG